MGRILLRDFVESDRPGFLAYHGDARYCALGGPQAADPEHSAALFHTFLSWASEQPRRNYQLAIVATANPQAIVGCGGLRGVERDGSAELGIELAPAFWG